MDKKAYYIITALMLLCSPALAELEILFCPSYDSQILIENDYKLLKGIYEIYPSSRKLAKLTMTVFGGEASSTVEGNVDKSFHIMTMNNRGIWLHELAHYFSYHLDDRDKIEFFPEVMAHYFSYHLDDRDKIEFFPEVIENIANGMSYETYKKYFSYNK